MCLAPSHTHDLIPHPAQHPLVTAPGELVADLRDRISRLQDRAAQPTRIRDLAAVVCELSPIPDDEEPWLPLSQLAPPAADREDLDGAQAAGLDAPATCPSAAAPLDLALDPEFQRSLAAAEEERASLQRRVRAGASGGRGPDDGPAQLDPALQAAIEGRRAEIDRFKDAPPRQVSPHPTSPLSRQVVREIVSGKLAHEIVLASWPS